jgi:hypothetical protein
MRWAVQLVSDGVGCAPLSADTRPGAPRPPHRRAARRARQHAPAHTERPSACRCVRRAAPPAPHAPQASQGKPAFPPQPAAAPAAPPGPLDDAGSPPSARRGAPPRHPRGTTAPCSLLLFPAGCAAAAAGGPRWRRSRRGAARRRPNAATARRRAPRAGAPLAADARGCGRVGWAPWQGGGAGPRGARPRGPRLPAAARGWWHGRVPPRFWEFVGGP